MMANNLTPAQRAAFAGPAIAATGFRRALTLERGATVIDVSTRVNKFGSTRVEAQNWHPTAGGGRISYPAITIEVMNPDGFFSPRCPGSIFAGTAPDTWNLRLQIFDELSVAPPGRKLSDTLFALKEPDLSGPTARLVGIHALAREWSRQWARSDRWATDWNGNAHASTFTYTP